MSLSNYPALFLLRKIMQDEVQIVRLCVAKEPMTSVTSLSYLFKDNEPKVLRQGLTTPRVTMYTDNRLFSRNKGQYFYGLLVISAFDLKS